MSRSIGRDRKYEKREGRVRDRDRTRSRDRSRDNRSLRSRSDSRYKVSCTIIVCCLKDVLGNLNIRLLTSPIINNVSISNPVVLLISLGYILQFGRRDFL